MSPPKRLGRPQGDDKFGRLFTERDVERILAEALIRQPTASKLAEVLKHIDPSELTFAPDEPLFLLRVAPGERPGSFETRLEEFLRKAPD